MPYIKKERRLVIDAGCNPENAGELNYLITTIIQDYAKSKGGNYQAYNDVMGVLEGAKLEIYRRIVAPYEDEKIKENGDVLYVDKRDGTY